MRRLIVISGAGLSVESGIRAFRTDSASGKAMWGEYDVGEVCDIHAFRGNFYHKTHMFYNKRREELQTVEPNVAHLRIGEWYKKYPGQVINITTNVDDLIERAGVPREDILHVHGFLREILVGKSMGSKPHRVIDVGYSSIEPDDFDWVKPNVVFFGEMAPLYQDMHAIFDSLHYGDMVIVVGCSNQVINFNWDLFPVLNIGVKMVVVNPNINYIEEQGYQERGIPVYRCGAVEAFGNKHFINMVEAHLEDRLHVRK